MSAGDQFGAEREEVAAAARDLAARGLVSGTAGNVSRRAGAELLEWICSLAYHALAIGSPQLVSPEQIEETGRRAADLRYGQR